MMKTVMTSLAILTAILLVMLVTLAAVAWQGHRQLAAANTKLSTELTETRLALEAAATEGRSVSNRLVTVESNATVLEAQVAELKASAEVAEATLPRPYRVRAFLGKDSLGEAWMIPQNIRRDPESGRYQFEPVLFLDASARSRFTVHHTNYVQTEILATEYTPYYYGYPYYYGVWQPGPPGGSNRPPVNPHPPEGMPPAAVSPGYGDVSASARVFAPPFSSMNTRPQVLGRPATSRANAEVFAP